MALRKRKRKQKKTEKKKEQKEQIEIAITDGNGTKCIGRKLKRKNDGVTRTSKIIEKMLQSRRTKPEEDQTAIIGCWLSKTGSVQHFGTHLRLRIVRGTYYA